LVLASASGVVLHSDGQQQHQCPKQLESGTVIRAVSFKGADEVVLLLICKRELLESTTRRRLPP